MKLSKVPSTGVEPATCRASTGRSYRTELQGRGTCAPTRIRAGGRRARSSGGGTRTRDPELMKLMLYHLSYARIHAANSALTLYDAASIIFCPGGRTRTYDPRLIRTVLSPTELRRKRRKQNCGRSAPHLANMTVNAQREANARRAE